MSDEIGFQVGDAVRLRVDGSPAMTVDGIEPDGRLLCVWADGAGKVQSQAFPPRSLKACDPAPSTRPDATRIPLG